MNNVTKNIVLWIVVLMVLLSVFNTVVHNSERSSEVSYTDFYDKLNDGQVQSVVVDDKTGVHKVITAQLMNGEKITVNAPKDDKLIDDLIKKNVDATYLPFQEESIFFRLLETILPILLLVGLWFFIMRQMQGGGGKGGAMSFGKSKAKLLSEDQIKVTFADVAGVEEAKEEVGEIVDFLRDPGKFQKLGGHIPRGVLMVGSPGTGKTLLAKAIAGEAKVPFFTISGSDFVEMFVGVGASRVRDMFDQAKKNAPCIIFIDEIDAVGRQRGAGMGGGHDEREQTLNQLLVEMDGFEGNEGVIVIAATNRPDVLDKALLRPGRFDRQVVVPLPDILGREAILKVHMKKVPLADDVKPKMLARGTPGFSGADLANLVNEAALFAARENAKIVTMENFEKAKDKIMMGAERKSMVMDEHDRKVTAYHEAGHAIVGYLSPEHNPIYKVTIIPRGRALGVTMSMPVKDEVSITKTKLESQIAMAYGGRIAEELLGGPEAISTGASSDIQHATNIARNMVTKWGFGEGLGPLLYSEDEGEVFLGRQVTQHKNVSDATAKLIDDAIKKIIDDNYGKATKILQDNIDKLHTMSEALMKYETLNSEQVVEIMEGKEITPPDGWDDDDTSINPKSKNKEEKKSGKDNIGGEATSS
ncbi:MAG TPA: ATP-dependent zinc metalloprotease FtsH [Gammaproteobacteria bacterium]|nr:ATP-dependent zinc metalloprotease FtsH [Xanthomonadales bacterium]HPI94774.1 ATP-dependent zinc metalloprotease FtsH [Gammaproteobacteria bacterium]HPQ86367.1 ATP-dependent zinc metalloprotease FtsH [Gammaproteobacteria bacterium]